MSPFRAGDENFPESEQIVSNPNIGLAYPPVEGSDSDDSGKDFVNVHLDFFPEDFVQAQRNWEDLISYKKSYLRLEEERAKNQIEEKIFQNQLDETSLELLGVLLGEGSFLQSLEERPHDNLGRHDLTRVRVDNGVNLRARLESRDKKWNSAHSDIMNQKGVQADFSWLDMMPQNVLGPIIISNRASYS